MTWGTAGSLLLGTACVGVVVGALPLPVRTWMLAWPLGLLATLVFLPGECVTAIASGSVDEPLTEQGITSCRTFYGVGLPQLRSLGEDGVGWLLAVVGGAVAACAVVLTRQSRGPTPGRPASGEE